MRIQQGDFIVLKIGNRPQLACCTHAEEKEFKGRLERTRDQDDKDSAVEFRASDVVANLGKRPRYGTVHGIKVEPLVTRLPSQSKMWQDIRVYQFLDKQQLKVLADEIASATAELRKFGLGILRCELEIRQKSGTMAGYYKYRPKAETDILCCKPEENLEGFLYIMGHEAGHGMWNRMLTPRIRLKWIHLYHEYITTQEVADAEMQAVLAEIVAASSIRDYLKEADDDSLLIVKDALRHIQRVHGLGRHHLELALNNNDDITPYWPTALELSSKEEAITKYGSKNPEEFMAEAFGFHVCGRKIPRKIEGLLDQTLSKLKKA